MLRGLFELKQKRQFFVRPGRVSVTFGEPITFPRGITAAEIAKQLETRFQDYQDCSGLNPPNPKKS
jgi:hypothetical protein